MLSTFLYFIVAYSSVALLMNFISWAASAKKISNKVVALLITLLLLLPLYPYAKVAFLTRSYKSELLPAVRDSQESWGWPNKRIQTVRVLNLSPGRAGVYVLSECSNGDAGIVVRLKNTRSHLKKDVVELAV
jgi:hypothetical protein